YHRIFTRCGLAFRAVEADTGTIGGSFSHEFMVLADTGEDTIVICTECEYAANMEKGRYQTPPPSATPPLLAPEKIETPGKKKVAAVTEFLGISPKALVKTLVYMAEDKPVAVLLRGDHEVQTVKLANALGVNTDNLRLADDKEIFDATGVPSGYLGPIGLKIPVLADNELTRMHNFAIGANEKNFHLLNANLNRDFTPQTITDLRQITSEDRCPLCGGSLELTRSIEVGHIFKLGTQYSEALKATFLDNQGMEQSFIMGCYGIGVSRTVAAAIEQNHDKDGMIFPLPIAPFQVILLNLSPKDEAITAAASELYSQLGKSGIEVLLDDRDERPGSKFKDADLLGIPYRVMVGKGFSEKGEVEIRDRATGTTLSLPLTEAGPRLVDLVRGALAPPE
ncbi:MAG: proline--tRNA ligase, partial [Desulfurivibrionaceae bacterium]|nr:proline--tRNA ligase [Desulfurivibrionaceae bacterium]